MFGLLLCLRPHCPRRTARCGMYTCVSCDTRSRVLRAVGPRRVAAAARDDSATPLSGCRLRFRPDAAATALATTLWAAPLAPRAHGADKAVAGCWALPSRMLGLCSARLCGWRNVPRSSAVASVIACSSAQQRLTSRQPGDAACCGGTGAGWARGLGQVCSPDQQAPSPVSPSARGGVVTLPGSTSPIRTTAACMVARCVCSLAKTAALSHPHMLHVARFVMFRGVRSVKCWYTAPRPARYARRRRGCGPLATESAGNIRHDTVGSATSRTVLSELVQTLPSDSKACHFLRHYVHTPVCSCNRDRVYLSQNCPDFPSYPCGPSGRQTTPF